MPDALPGKLNIELYAGDDFELPLTFTDSEDNPLDTTGWTVTAQLRKSINGNVVQSFEVNIPTPYNSGNVDLKLSSEQTADLKGIYLWDAQRDLGGIVRTVVRGRAKVIRDVTRPVIEPPPEEDEDVTIVVKTADQNFATDVLEDITDLVIPIGANETWVFDARLHYKSPTTPPLTGAQVKLGVTIPAGATFKWVPDYNIDDEGNMAPRDETAELILTAGGYDNDALGVIRGIIINGATAGSLQLKAASETVLDNPAIVYAQSHIIAWKKA